VMGMSCCGTLCVYQTIVLMLCCAMLCLPCPAVVVASPAPPPPDVGACCSVALPLRHFGYASVHHTDLLLWCAFLCLCPCCAAPPAPPDVGACCSVVLPLLAGSQGLGSGVEEVRGPGGEGGEGVWCLLLTGLHCLCVCVWGGGGMQSAPGAYEQG
jgi:hypothetical protein